MKLLFILLFPVAVFAQQTLENSDFLEEGRVKVNANFTELYTNPQAPNRVMSDSSLNAANTAFVFRNAISRNLPNYGFSGNTRTYKIYPINENPTHGTKPIEILNFGYSGAEPTSSRHNVTGVIGKLNWSTFIAHNWTFDSVNNRSTTYNSSWPTTAAEAGGEGFSFHTAPTGSTWYTQPTMNILISGNGPRGVPGYTSGWVNQFNSVIYGHYATDSYQTGKLRSWQPSTATDPILFLHAEETKGTDFEFSRYEQNSGNASSGAFYFAKSRGTYLTKTAVSGGDGIGRIGWKAYDGDEYHINAYIDVITPSNASNNTVPLDIRFVTSATAQASGTEKFRVSGDGVVKTFVGFRNELTTVTGIPSYSAFASFVPTTTGATSLDMRPLSTTNGGMLISGLTNVTNSAIALLFQGLQGHTSPTAANTVFKAAKHNGTTSAADIAATEIGFQFRNNATTLIEILGNGKAGFGATTPHTRVQTTSFATGYVAKTALYTLTDADHTVEVTSGTHTQTLPTSVGISGREYVVTNTGSGTVTVGTTSSQTFINVSGTPTTLTLAQFETAWVQSNGANWLRLK